MADSFTSNYDLVLQITGSNSGTWGTDVNNNLISPLDSILGGTLGVVMSNADITLSLSQWQNKFFEITGTLVANVNLILPLSPNAIAGTPSVNGHFIVQNATTGNFSVTVKTAQSGGPFLTQQVPQGGPPIGLVSTSGHVLYADGALGVPVGSVMDFAGASAPPGWLLCFGQSLLTARYAALFAAIGYTYGGAGANFSIPDYRGRATAGKDDMGGSAANRIGVVVTDNGTITGTTLGSAGGSSTHAQIAAELATHTHTDSGHTHPFTGPLGGAIANVQGGANPIGNAAAPGTTGSGNANIQNTGNSQAMAWLQPTVITNKIIFAGA